MNALPRAESPSRTPEGPPRSSARTLIVILIVAALLSAAIVGVRLFVFAPYRIPSASMVPSLEVNEHVVANLLARTPHYGDIYVFVLPEQPSQTFAKRVLALPGDRLEMRDMQPVINGWSVPRCRVGPWTFQSDGSSHTGDIYLEFLGPSAYLVFDDAAWRGAESPSGPWTAKADEVWVLGDNRRNSFDSRMWAGGAGAGVPTSFLRGRISGHDTPRLPEGAAALGANFARCLASRPSVTTPPRP